VEAQAAPGQVRLHDPFRPPHALTRLAQQARDQPLEFDGRLQLRQGFPDPLRPAGLPPEVAGPLPPVVPPVEAVVRTPAAAAPQAELGGDKALAPEGQAVRRGQPQAGQGVLLLPARPVGGAAHPDLLHWYRVLIRWTKRLPICAYCAIILGRTSSAGTAAAFSSWRICSSCSAGLMR
jgi:hypothetical protein